METISIFLLPQGDRGIVLSVENFSSRHLGKGGQTKHKDILTVKIQI
jgi:hypothetical protein